MIIDFHTHIFPDKVAPKAIAKLADCIHMEPTHNGTYDGLLRSTENAGIDISVVLPVVTAPHQFDSVIRFAEQVNEKFYQNGKRGLFSLAGIHPDSDNYADQLKLIKSFGFPGLKIHPDYQGREFNDIRYKRILDKASELGLFVLTHAGFDVYSPDKIHCTVAMIMEVLEEVVPERLVLAHMGNNMFYDSVEAMLLGEKVYIDTSYSIAHVAPERLLRMIRKHGADKVLFASDAPWSDQKNDVEILKSLGLNDNEFARISHKNALKLLDL